MAPRGLISPASSLTCIIPSYDYDVGLQACAIYVVEAMAFWEVGDSVLLDTFYEVLLPNL